MPKEFYSHCGKKVRHETRRKTGVAMDAYKCDFCGGFHVGHASKRRERMRKVTP
jgi:hypothetical protein